MTGGPEAERTRSKGPPVDRPAMSVLDAVIFDLDGVVTFTARLHAAAWKELFDGFLRSWSQRAGEPFREFTDEDYRRHVDGRPRLEGVRSFLTSRGISLPEEGAGQNETVAALGTRKNAVFHRLLTERGVEVDHDAVRFIRQLREQEIPVGVASSSRNTRVILARAGLDDLFDARVDGEVSARLRLAGKPAPDIFLACLDLLGAEDPQNAVVVEDAAAGVRGGRAGDFGLVVGVDRQRNHLALREAGADWVIRSFADLSPAPITEWLANRQFARPNALAHFDDLEQALDGRTPALFLDYDGTLTPIVARPDLATLSGAMREALRRVAQAWPTTVVSGRGREDVTALVGIPELHYAGSHGFDIAGPRVKGGRHEVDPALVPIVTAAAAEMRRRTSALAGVIVEDKKYAVAVHYRLVEDDLIAEVERQVDEVLRDMPELRKAGGKKVFELRPAIPWDKGRAVLWLLREFGLDRPDVVPVYVGDDETDEDAFGALENRGIGILVTDLPRPTRASLSLQDVEEVGMLLERLAVLRETAAS